MSGLLKRNPSKLLRGEIPSPTKSFPENLPPAWKEKLSSEASKSYFIALREFLNEEISQRKEIYPAREHILRALQLVDLPKVKVVILGQDPYHGPGQAIGLSFAVPNSLRVKPPSLVNIYKEIEQDLGIELNRSKSDLLGWTAQGVLLLNTVLTVRKSIPFSHRDRGWEIFTDKIIQILNERERPLVFLLWGAAAQKKKSLLTNSKHLILLAAHPSPFSADKGFFGCKHFSKTNQFLNQLAETPINWAQISDV